MASVAADGDVFRSPGGDLLAANGQSYTILHSFDGSDGSNPSGSLTLSGSTLYGMAYNGGSESYGTIFSIGDDGSGFNLLQSCINFGGRHPSGNLTLSGTTLYGMTPFGGIHGAGDIFQIGTDGTGARELYTFFAGNSNGYYPDGSLTLSGTTMYGMAEDGGNTVNDASGGGTLFSIGTDGTFNLLYEFGSIPNDGAHPFYGNFTKIGSTLYSVTGQGGSTGGGGAGTVFRINSDGTAPQVVHSFDGSDGLFPEGSMTLGGSTFYGMTYRGGNNGQGVVYSVNSDGTGFRDLHTFTGAGEDGSSPFGGLVISGSTLYGMTSGGGAYGEGEIFSIGTDGSDYDDLLDFNGSNGASPSGDLILSDSTLYGMTSGGGANNDGTIFAYNLKPTPEPATLALVAAGGIGLVAYRWRRRRKNQAAAEPIALEQDAPATLSLPSRRTAATRSHRVTWRGAPHYMYTVSTPPYSGYCNSVGCAIRCFMWALLGLNPLRVATYSFSLRS